MYTRSQPLGNVSFKAPHGGQIIENVSLKGESEVTSLVKVGLKGINASDAISTCIDDGLGWNSAPVFVGASAGLESIGVKTADLEGMFLNRKGWFKRDGAQQSHVSK